MRRSLAALGAASALACTACAPQGMNFRVDERISITAPREDAEVSLPLTLRWSARDFAGTFGVFLDTTPMPPGEALDELRDEGVACDGECTDASYFAQLGIYTTTDTQLTITALPPGTDDEEEHRATVVLLDAEGVRQGESAWHVDFRVPEQNESAS